MIEPSAKKFTGCWEVGKDGKDHGEEDYKLGYDALFGIAESVENGRYRRLFSFQRTEVMRKSPDTDTIKSNGSKKTLK
jgi:hypothetical protein